MYCTSMILSAQCQVLSFPIKIVNKIVQDNSSFLKNMIEDGLLSAANISAALLGINRTFLRSVCDRARASRQGRACPVPAPHGRSRADSMQAQVACQVFDDFAGKFALGIGGFRPIKREIILVSVSAVLLGDNNATMDYIPFFCWCSVAGLPLCQ